MKVPKIIGIIFLFVQCISIGVATTIPEKFFCWAPYDEHTLLRTKVVIDTTELTYNQINQRYRYSLNDWEPRAVHNVLDLVEQYERTYGSQDSANVIIEYTTNGNPSKVWVYPKPKK